MKFRTKRLMAVLLSVLVAAELVVTVLLGTVADGGSGTKTVTKQLLDFSQSAVAEEIEDTAWPTGLSKMTSADTYAYDSNCSVDIAETDDGEKFLKFNFDQAKSVGSNDYIAERTNGHKLFVKVSVPFEYIPYLKEFKVDMLYNYKQLSGNTTDAKKQAFYVLGVKDGVAWGKDVRSHYSIAPTNAKTIEESKTVEFANIKRLTASNSIQNFLKNTTGYLEAPTYTKNDLINAGDMEILIMFSVPEITAAMRNRGYFFGIKGISFTVEGTEEEIDNIGKPKEFDSHLVNFEEGTTLAEITSATGFNPQARGQLVTEGAHSGTNAYLYRRKQGTSGVDYDTRVGLPIDKSKSKGSKGLTFVVKNISEVTVNFRLWIAVGTAQEGTNDQKIGKYHYTFAVSPNMTDYKRITLTWDNIGLTDYTHGGFSGGTSSGNAMTQAEINSGINIKILQNGLSIDDAGVLFDTFELIDEEYMKACQAVIADFENSDIGKNDIPSNVSIGGTYGGSVEIAEDINGNKGLQLNYDVAQTKFSTDSGQGHHLRYRPYFQVSVSIPKGVLKDSASLIFDVTNNRADAGTFAQKEEKFSGAAYVVGISNGSDYGKDCETRNEIKFVGNSTISKTPTNIYHSSEGNLIGYQSKGDKWTNDELAEVDVIHFLVTAPYTEGTEGESFTINTITVSYNEPPKYIEGDVRPIFQTTKSETPVSDTLKVTDTVVSSLDPNSTEFSETYKAEISAGNIEGILFTNDMTAYNRNLKPFIETAMLHMFVKADAATELEVSLSDRNGALLSHKFTVEPTGTKLYSEVNIPVKDIYDAYITANPDGGFDFTDIKTMSVKSLSTAAATIYVAKPEILTGDYVSNANNPEALKNVNLVNFDNVDDIDNLPIGFAVNCKYGTLKIVEKEDGSKALRLVYDEALTIDRRIAYNQVHQLVNRTECIISVTVPATTLTKLKSIKYTMNANLPEFDNNDRYPNTYYQTVVSGGGANFKAGQSALAYNFVMNRETTYEFDLYAKNSIGSTSGSSIANWLNPEGALKVDETYASQFTTIQLRVGIAEVTGKEGYWFELSSIDLCFDEEPTYEKDAESRTIVQGDRLGKISNGTIKVTYEDLPSNDINYRQFKTYYLLDAKKGNTEAAVIKNGNINFLRSAKHFLDTANFRLYVNSPAKTKLKLALVNFSDERLPFEIDVTKTKDAKYDEYVVPLKKIYDDFIAANPDGKFNLSNITAIEILPDSSSAIKIKVAEASLWTGEPGSGSSAGNFYATSKDDTVRIEGYKDAIPETFTATIEKYNDPAAEIEAQGVRIPAGTKPIAMAKFTLRGADGSISEPSNNFWISLKFPEGTDVSDIGIYRVFLDGSLVKLRHAIEPDNFITANTFFSMDTFVVLSGVNSSVITDTEEPEDTTEEPEYEEIVDDEPEEDETVITTKPNKIIRKKKYIIKKAAGGQDLTWLWITLAVVGAVIVLTTGVIVFLIIRKKRKNGKENVAV